MCLWLALAAYLDVIFQLGDDSEEGLSPMIEDEWLVFKNDLETGVFLPLDPVINTLGDKLDVFSELSVRSMYFPVNRPFIIYIY